MNGARSKPRYTGIFHIPVERQRIIKTHKNFVRRVATKCHSFASAQLPLVSTLMEIPQGNTMENSGKQNPKMGFKSPPEQEASHLSGFF